MWAPGGGARCAAAATRDRILLGPIAASLVLPLHLTEQARPGSGIGLQDSPTGSSLPNSHEAATKQITAKAHGTMLSRNWAWKLLSHPKFLAQAPGLQELLKASQ
jgi:hypothetical protein